MDSSAHVSLIRLIFNMMNLVHHNFVWHVIVLKENQTLYVWDETFVKTLEFDAVGKTQVQGIDVYKYEYFYLLLYFLSTVILFQLYIFYYHFYFYQLMRLWTYISTCRYVLNEKAFDVSQVYTNTIEGTTLPPLFQKLPSPALPSLCPSLSPLSP